MQSQAKSIVGVIGEACYHVNGSFDDLMITGYQNRALVKVKHPGVYQPTVGFAGK